MQELGANLGSQGSMFPVLGICGLRYIEPWELRSLAKNMGTLGPGIEQKLAISECIHHAGSHNLKFEVCYMSHVP